MAFALRLKSMFFGFEAGKLVAVMHELDAAELGVLPLDRIEIFNPLNKKSIAAVVDHTKTEVQKGEIGLFEDLRKELEIKKPVDLEVRAVGQPETMKYIRKKIHGERLSEQEIKSIVEDIDKNRLSELELSAFMTAVYINGFDLDETVAMTRALIDNGNRLELDVSPVLDKHSVGGINGRTTMLVVPIVAAAGYYIPKTSSRAITTAAGTADSMETLCNVSLSLEKMKEITEKIGGTIAWGGALDLAPVDDKIIKIERPLFLDPEGQIIASVMAKKASVGAKYLVIDIPVGENMKVKSKEKASRMAFRFVEVGNILGIGVEAVLTDGEEPNGKAFGPALEAKYALEILEGKFFDKMAQKSCELAGALFELVGACRKGSGFEKAKEILESGKALQKFQEIIAAQGGKPIKSEQIAPAKFRKQFLAEEAGEIKKINVSVLHAIARLAGAPADKKAGLIVEAELGSRVEKGQPLFEIFAENERKLKEAFEHAKRENPMELEKVVLGKFA